jgi:hypothetical protein
MLVIEERSSNSYCIWKAIRKSHLNLNGTDFVAQCKYLIKLLTESRQLRVILIVIVGMHEITWLLVPRTAERIGTTEKLLHFILSGRT